MRMTALAVTTAFLLMALFSFGAMLHPMGEGGATCLASKIQNGDCPPEDFSVAAAFFHINAFQTFSLAILAFSLALAAVAALSSSRFKEFPRLAPLRQPLPAPAGVSSFRKTQSALARFELSPTT